MRIEYFTKLLIFKKLPSDNLKALNSLVIYEQDHKANDKTIKLLQYRKLYVDTHQLMMLNKTKEEVLHLIELNSRTHGYYFGFSMNDVIYASDFSITSQLQGDVSYTYLLNNYNPFNSNDRYIWNDSRISDENRLALLGENLTEHLIRILNLIDCQEEELKISIDKKSIRVEDQPFEKISSPIITLVFHSNIKLPWYLNIGGLRTSVYGQLYPLYNDL